MTDEKNPQDRSEALENTLTSSQKKDARIAQKIAPFAALTVCVWLFSVELYLEWAAGRTGDSFVEEEKFRYMLVLCFLCVGFAMKGQHDRIRKLEASLAARDENPTQ